MRSISSLCGSARVAWRLVCCVLTLACVVHVGEAQAYGKETVVVREESVVVCADEDGASNDELLAGYVRQVLDEPICGDGELRTQSVCDGLPELDAYVYDKLLQFAKRVAAGEEKDAIFSMPYSELEALGVELGPWSAAELGVNAVESDGYITPEAVAALGERIPIHLESVHDALLRDAPFEFYWYDKSPTGGVELGSIGYSVTYSNGEECLDCHDAVLQVKMRVAREFSASGTTGDTQVREGIAAPAFAAVEKAQTIVAENEGKGVYDRLDAYRAAICDEVDYNHAAADEANNTPYGNPWQLVWVFDDVEDTKVVCEGYSKAFKYLCDLTWPEDDSGENPLVECLLVSGYMAGGTGAGAHMWNVVRADDGKNYLVDVTNCDEGSIGAPDHLFMAYGPSGSYATQYDFAVADECQTSYVSYVYDDDTRSLFGEKALTISATPYEPPAEPEPPTPPATRVDLSGATVGFAQEDYVYASAELEPEPIVTLDGTQLVAGRDYAYAFDANRAVGTATVTVTGTGDYAGSATGTFDIVPATLTGLRWANLSFVYDGEQYCPTAEALGLIGDDTTEVVVDGAAVDAGTHVATAVSLKNGNYALPAERTVEFVIAKATSSISLEAQTKAYTGFALAYDGKVTKSGSDGVVTYAYYSDASCAQAVDAADVVEAGTYYVVATLDGDANHEGAVSEPVEFVIRRADIDVSGAVVSASSQTYTGEPLEPTPSILLDGKELDASLFTVVYDNNTNVGTATVTVAAKAGSGYTGTASGTFEIAPVPSKDLAGAAVEIVGDEARFVFPGIASNWLPVEWEPDVVVTLDGTTVPSNAYTVTYEDNVYPGTAKIIITANGSSGYEGSVVRTFEIRKGTQTNYGGGYNDKVYVEYYPLQSNAQSVNCEFHFVDVVGDPSFRKIAGDDSLTIDTHGVMTIAKGTPVGEYKMIVRVTLSETDWYEEGSDDYEVVAYVVDSRGSNPLTVSATSVTTGSYDLKTTVATVMPIAVSGAAGAVSYKKASGASCLTVNATTGRVTVAKGTKEGTYTAKVSVTAAGDATHKPATKQVTVSVKVADTRKANTLAVTAKTVTAGSYALKAKAAVVAPLTVSGAKGTVSYKKASGASCLSVNATTGRVTVAKGTKEGTYTAKVAVSAAGDAAHKPASKTVAVTVKVADTRKANPMKVKAATKSASAKTLKGKAVAVAPLSVTGARGKVSYKKASGSSCLAVNATTGKVTIKKGAKAGTYTAKVTVTAAGDSSYKPASKTVAIKVTVK